MLCQNCRKNEADKTFVINFMGGTQEIYMCNECLEKMWNYAGMAGQKEMFTAVSGWWPGKEDPRDNGRNPFPQDAGMVLKTKRQISALRARLEEAVKKENYEEAAGLRDRISEMELKQEVS